MYETRHGLTGKREIKRALDAWVRDIESGEHEERQRREEAGRTTVDIFLDRYLAFAKGQVRPRTWRRYEELLRLHVRPYIGTKPVGQVTGGDIQAIIDATAAKKLNTTQLFALLRAAFRWAVTWKLRADNPLAGGKRHADVRAPRSRKPLLTVPTEAQLRAIRDAAADGPHAVEIALAIGTGMRRGETLALQWEDVDLDERRAMIRRSAERNGRRVDLVNQTKSGRVRRVPIPEWLVDTLRHHKVRQNERRLASGPLWSEFGLVVDDGTGAPIHPDVLSRYFDRLMTRLGNPYSAMRLHDLRHGLASTLLRRGVPVKTVSELLGHHSAAFTLDTYAHVIPADLDLAAGAVEKAFA